MSLRYHSQQHGKVHLECHDDAGMRWRLKRNGKAQREPHESMEDIQVWSVSSSDMTQKTYMKNLMTCKEVIKPTRRPALRDATCTVKLLFRNHPKE